MILFLYLCVNSSFSILQRGWSRSRTLSVSYAAGTTSPLEPRGSTTQVRNLFLFQTHHFFIRVAIDLFMHFELSVYVCLFVKRCFRKRKFIRKFFHVIFVTCRIGRFSMVGFAI